MYLCEKGKKMMREFSVTALQPVPTKEEFSRAFPFLSVIVAEMLHSVRAEIMLSAVVSATMFGIVFVWVSRYMPLSGSFVSSNSINLNPLSFAYFSATEPFMPVIASRLLQR